MLKIKGVVELDGEIEEGHNKNKFLNNFIGKGWLQRKIIQFQYLQKKITQ